jgi:glycosyltransferase involved in cell wall biosynthesis
METIPASQLFLVMPTYNEEATIKGVLAEWVEAIRAEGVPITILVVNDGSTDDTARALQECDKAFPGTVQIINKSNSGHGRSCRVGYEAALACKAKWILQVDSDGQCDPTYFSQFWRARELADCIFGFRTTRGDGYLRSLVSFACRCLTFIVTGADLKDANVPYRLMSREALEDGLSKTPADFDIQNVALTLALKRNPTWRWRHIPIHFRQRRGGVNSINLQKIVKMGWKMLVQLKNVRM